MLKKDRPGTWQDALQQFLWFKQAENLSPTTLNGYQTYIGLFFKQFPEAYDEANLKQSLSNFMAQQAKSAHYNLKLAGWFSIHLFILVKKYTPIELFCTRE